jgi:hypothetical protein
MSDAPPQTDPDWQRQAATDAFNLTWQLLDKSDRSPDESDQMLHAAHASRFYWQAAGDAVNWLRGDWLLARVYTVLNQPSLALHFARLCLERCEANGFGDFDLAYAYEGVARAAACAGDRVEAEKFQRLATKAGKAIVEDEDRELFTRDLAGPPWFGLTISQL